MQNDRNALSIPPDRLRARCDPNSFTFETTASLPPPPRMVGQERAAEALDFGLGVRDNHYHLYVAGAPGVGRSVAAVDAVRRIAALMPVPDDWCYVYNFTQPYAPQALALPAGRAKPFADAVDDLVASTRQALQDALQSDLYRTQRRAALQAIDAQREAIDDQFKVELLQRGFVMQNSEKGPNFIAIKPRKDPNTPLEAYSDEELNALPSEVKAHINANFQTIPNLYANAVLAMRKLDVQAREVVEQLDQAIAQEAVKPLFEALREQYATLPAVVAYLDGMRADIVEHADEVRDDGNEENDNNVPKSSEDTNPAAAASARPPSILARYHVNVLVDRTGQQGAPYINEHNPTYYNLTGRLEYGQRAGNLYTDFNFLKAGALHQANGGFLIIHIKELVSAGPKPWEALKRALRAEQVTIENITDQPQAIIATSLKPDPIPLNVKIVLLGGVGEWDALNDDPDFIELFKVRADFDSDMPRNARTEMFYAQFTGDVARSLHLAPLDRAAVARIVEEGSRMAENQTRLTSVLTDVRDLVIEAGYWAQRSPSPVITAAHVNQATLTRKKRLGLRGDCYLEQVRQGRVLISTNGAAVGQCNALSVATVLGASIGLAMRVTARVAPGMAGVVAIEREAEMSGPIHTKGVKILAGYLAGQFGQEEPLSLSATLTFEQTYGGVEGDSASLAELCTLLSSLSELPIAQSLAMTGSVNQWGEVQTIGDVTNKIEGFFATCQASPANAPQGVIIPESNVRDLMLGLDVLEAVHQGRFFIFGVRTVAQAVELLMGRPAGSRGADGSYLAGTVNALVAEKLHLYAERVRQFRSQGY